MEWLVRIVFETLYWLGHLFSLPLMRFGDRITAAVFYGPYQGLMGASTDLQHWYERRIGRQVSWGWTTVAD